MEQRTVPWILAGVCTLAGLARAGEVDKTVTFDDGPEGWTIQNAVTIEQQGGNPGAFLSHFQIDTFGVNVSNSTSPEFVGDFTEKGESVTIGADFEFTKIWDFFVGDVPREWIIEIRDFDLGGDAPWASVWYSFGVVTSGTPWTTFSVTIEDTSATELPPGWKGAGAEDPDTFEPVLPEGVTFADVLAGADEVVFTSFVPGFFFTFHNWDFGVDNVFITGEGGGCVADCDGSGSLNVLDFTCFQALFAAEDAGADVNADGALNVLDFVAFQAEFAAGCG